MSELAKSSGYSIDRDTGKVVPNRPETVTEEARFASTQAQRETYRRAADVCIARARTETAVLQRLEQEEKADQNEVVAAKAAAQAARDLAAVMKMLAEQV